MLIILSHDVMDINVVLTLMKKGETTKEQINTSMITKRRREEFVKEIPAIVHMHMYIYMH